MAPSWTRGVLERIPEVDHVIDSPLIHKELNISGLWHASRLLKNKYDKAILLPNSFKSALIPWLAHIPIRVGYKREGRGVLLNHAITLDTKRHPLMVERFLALSESKVEFNHSLYPQLVPNLLNQQELIHRLNLHLDLPIIVLCPGAEYGPAKRWPTRHYHQLAIELLAQNKQIWIMGSNKDKAVADEIMQGVSSKNITNLCGITNLAQAVDLMALAQAVVTNDSGLMHIAAALKRPVVALFGSSSPQFTPPLCSQAKVVTLQLSCSPCFQRVCPLGHLKCLTDITPQHIINELNSLAHYIEPNP
ncbi:ADP-heptose--LPS heptosyltransferase 2 [Ferrovum sp. PN-J185]|nr:ADP-heptose--LPS heptosyltransferase 2 [Ferrovum sp. PN-J185]